MKNFVLLIALSLITQLAFAEKYLQETSFTDRVGVIEVSVAPPAKAGQGYLYNIADLPYWVDSAGNEFNLLLGGGASLDNLSDVTIVTPALGEVLIYNTVTSQWENTALPKELPDPTGHAGEFLTTDGSTFSWAPAASTLGALTDVTITTPVDGNILTYDTGVWINVPVSVPSLEEVRTVDNQLAGDVDYNSNDIVNIKTLGFENSTLLKESTLKKTLAVQNGAGIDFFVGQGQYTYITNNSGVDIDKGMAVSSTGILAGKITVAKALATSYLTLGSGLAITAMDIPNGTDGFITSFAEIPNIDTTSFTGAPVLYVSPTVAGELTNVRPVFPDYAIQVGAVVLDSLTGVISIDVKSGISDTFNDAFDGSFRESINFLVSSDNINITGTLENVNNADDLTMLFSDGFSTLDTTPGATITLVPGTSEIPQVNYIYIPLSTKVLTVSTSGFPSEEHIKVADVLVQSINDVFIGDILVNRNWNDHIKEEGDNGHLLHLSERLRQNNAAWDTGTEGICTVGGGGSTVDVSVTSGTVYQLHKQAFPSLNTATGDHVHVPNHFTSAYLKTSDIETLVADSTGASLNNTSYSFVLVGVQNKSGTPSTLLLNLPTSTYSKTTPDVAVSDPDNYSVYDIPKAFKGKAFLIARYTYINNGGTITLHDTEDLRGKIPNVTAGGGGGGSGVTTFLGLTDTPSAYTGQALSLAQVNAGETALEFVTSITATLLTAAQPNITSVGTLTDLTVTNPIVGSITGNAATVTTITGLAPDTATTQAAQPNITSVGTLTSLDVAGVARASQLEGDHTEIQNQNQYGDDYNVANSSLTGGATAIVTGSVVQYTTGTLATSYFVFDDISLNLDKDTQGVIFHAAVSGVEADVAECFVYDGTDVVSQGVKLSGVSGDNLEYSIPVNIPDPIVTGLRVRCNQLTTTASTTIDVSKIQWTTSIYALINLTGDSDIVITAGNSGQIVTSNVTDIPFILSNGNNNWDGDSYTVPFDSIVRLSGAVAGTVASSARIKLYKNGVSQKDALVGNYNVSVSVKPFYVEIGDAKKDDVYSIRSSSTQTLSNAPTFHYMNISATPQGSSKGWANSADMPSNSYWFSTDTAITVNGTYTRAQLIASYGLKEGCSQGANCEFVDSIERVSTGNVNVDYTSKGLSDIPSIDAQIKSDGVGNARQDDVTSITTSSFRYTTTNTAASAGIHIPFSIIFGLQNEDLKTIPTVINAPVAVMENFPQYDIIGQLTNIASVQTATATPYVTSNNVWRMRFDIVAATDASFNITGVDFANTVTYNSQAITGWTTGGGATTSFSRAQSPNIVSSGFNAAGGFMMLHGDVELTGKPTWATDSYAASTGFIALDKTKVSEYANNKTSEEKVVGTWSGCPLYEKTFQRSSVGNGHVLSSDMKTSTVTLRGGFGSQDSGASWFKTIFSLGASYQLIQMDSSNLSINSTYASNSIDEPIRYTKLSECP